MPKIDIYCTDNCPNCEQAKKFFKQHKIGFNEINVTHDLAKQQEMIILTGGHQRVPVIAIDSGGNDKEVLLGFDQKTISELLHL